MIRGFEPLAFVAGIETPRLNYQTINPKLPIRGKLMIRVVGWTRASFRKVWLIGLAHFWDGRDRGAQ